MRKMLTWSRTLHAIQTLYVWGLFMIPLIFHAFPDTNKFDLIQIFRPFYSIACYLLVGVFLFAVAGWKDEKVKTPWALLAFTLWSTLAFVFAEVQTFGFAEIFVLWIGAILFLMFSVPAYRNMIRRYAPWFALAALVIHLVGGAYAFLQTDHSRFFGLFYNPDIKADAWPNAFASFFLLTFPLALAALDRLKKWAWLKGIIAGVLMVGMWMSFSRAGYIAFGIELMALAIFFWRDVHPKKKVLLPLIMALLFLFGGSLLLQNVKSSAHQATDIAERLTFSEAAGATSVSERLEFFTGSLSLIAMDPLFGSGPVSFKSAYPQVQQGFLALSDHPHNILLKYAVERGLPAAIFFVIFLVGLFWRNNPLDKKADPLDRFVWAGIIGLMAHSMVDFNLNFFSTVVLWWLSLAMVGRLEKARVNIMVFILMLFIFGAAIYQARPVFGSILPQWSIVARINELQDSDDFELRKTVAQEQLAYNEFDHHALAELARVAREEGRYDDAVAAYRLLLQVYPKNTFEYYLEYARLLKEQEMMNRLEELKERVIPLLEEFRDLEARNVHFIQSKPEGEYADELEQILDL